MKLHRAALNAVLLVVQLQLLVKLAAGVVDTWQASDLAELDPVYDVIGCYQDTSDTNFQSARRMWRRLGVSTTMTVDECARRADMTGYPYFGITVYEDDINLGWTCWGAWDRTFATALGTTTDCSLECDAPSCGTPFKLWLYILYGKQYDTGAGGKWETKTELPVSALQAVQVTGRDEFLLIDFLSGTHPPSWNNTYNVVLWNRNTNTWRPVYWLGGNTNKAKKKDAACGMWNRMPDGDLIGFAGHYGDNNFVRAFNAISVHQRHQPAQVEALDAALPFGRWYGGQALLPNGRLYVTGGTDDLGKGRIPATGSEVWDPVFRTLVGRTSNADINGPFKLNSDLTKSALGTYYPGLYMMPDGTMLFSNAVLVQTIDWATGNKVAQTPPLPINMIWEWPMAAPMVVLPMLPYTPGATWQVDLVVFGGHWQGTALKPCRDVSLRTTLTISGSNPTTHSFSEWQAETMPGPRCQSDAVLLPNGKVIILNGGECGLGTLETVPPANSYPQNEPWIYDPVAPYGARYRRTGVYTNIMRNYHNTGLLTSFGDILVTGTTLGRNFRTYFRQPFSITPWPTQEYRVETFTPPYILGTRPAFADNRNPSMVLYGSTFNVTLAANTTSSSIRSVVLMGAPSVTHSSAMGARHHPLQFTVVSGSILSVTAPRTPNDAPPCFYLLYLVAQDESYSIGRWVQLRAAGADGASTFAGSAMRAVPEASARFETTANIFSIRSGQATLAWSSSIYAGGRWGRTVLPRATAPIELVSRPFNVFAGARIHTHLWARAAAPGITVSMSLVDAANVSVAAAPWIPTATLSGKLSSSWEMLTLGGLRVPAANRVRVRLTLQGHRVNSYIYLDEVSTFVVDAGKVAPASVTAATVASLAISAGADPVPAGSSGSTPRRAASAPSSLPPVTGDPYEGMDIGNQMDHMMKLEAAIKRGDPGYRVGRP